MTFKIIPTLLIDSYKLSHRDQYPKGTKRVYSNFTPRGDKLFNSPMKDGKMIAFGYQGFLKNFLVDLFNENFFNLPEDEAVLPFQKEVELHLGVSYDVEHLRALHRLGYLPLRVKTLDEGTLVPMRVPTVTVVNTHDDFAWLVNYIETLMSEELWKPATTATTAFHYRKLVEEFADKTCDDKSHIPFQCHDFSARGMSGSADAASSAVGHLASFAGTDSVNAIPYARYAYGDEGFIGASVPATEHSVACANIALAIHEMKAKHVTRDFISEDQYRAMAEKEFMKRLLTEVYPSGIFSYVSDTFDFFRVISEIAPSLREEIMARDGKLVIRPDSGDPVKIICGYKNPITLQQWIDGEGGEAILFPNGKYVSIDHLSEDVSWMRDDNGNFIDWKALSGDEFSEFLSEQEVKGSIEVLFEHFGGSVNSKGYKVLDPHIGLIYGDSITLTRAKEILERLEEKGFASSNVVFGVGSFTYQYVTRDTFGFAMKATYIEIEGVDSGIDLCKDPKTGDGSKKSAKGLLQVVKDEQGNLVLKDGVSLEEESQGELKVRFENGKLFNTTTLAEIRDRINKNFEK